MVGPTIHECGVGCLHNVVEPLAFVSCAIASLPSRFFLLAFLRLSETVLHLVCRRHCALVPASPSFRDVSLEDFVGAAEGP